MREMVLPEDEVKIFRDDLEEHLTDTNQQLKKWLIRWRPVINHSMKEVKRLAKTSIKPIWRHFTADKPAKTVVKRHIPTRAHQRPRNFANNPLTNVFQRIQKKRSSSRTTPNKVTITKQNNLINTMFTTLGKRRSTSRVGTITEVEEQQIPDRYGDGWHK